jgi:uncharacterized sulfatase
VTALAAALTDSDSAVRYWAAMGYLIRGEAGVKAGGEPLRTALRDSSPYVRVVASQALAQYGSPTDLAPSLQQLGELAPPESNGVFVSMAALNAIETLGMRAAKLHDAIGNMKPQGKSPDARFDSYVPRLIANLTGAPPTQPAAKAGGKARKKNKKANK